MMDKIKKLERYHFYSDPMADCFCEMDTAQTDGDYVKHDDAMEIINVLEKELDKHRWTPVSERLPDNGYCIAHDGEQSFPVFYSDGVWTCLTTRDRKPTHWKPLDKPE